eukprot:4659064-Prymnesium_polylepis.1
MAAHPFESNRSEGWSASRRCDARRARAAGLMTARRRSVRRVGSCRAQTDWRHSGGGRHPPCGRHSPCGRRRPCAHPPGAHRPPCGRRRPPS